MKTRAAAVLVALMWALPSQGQVDCTTEPESPDCQGGGASGEALLVAAAVATAGVWLVGREVRKRRAERLARVLADPALARYDDNRNGRIGCREARRHGIAPVPRGHPAYPYARDRDGDGVACEGRRRSGNAEGAAGDDARTAPRKAHGTVAPRPVAATAS